MKCNCPHIALKLTNEDAHELRAFLAAHLRTHQTLLEIKTAGHYNAAQIKQEERQVVLLTNVLSQLPVRAEQQPLFGELL